MSESASNRGRPPDFGTPEFNKKIEALKEKDCMPPKEPGITPEDVDKYIFSRKPI
jgi:hypothetical protein